jgi:hypothetical protein
LKETIRFPHLEGIKLAIKNIVPSSDLSISPRLGVSSAY